LIGQRFSDRQMDGFSFLELAKQRVSMNGTVPFVFIA